MVSLTVGNQKGQVSGTFNINVLMTVLRYNGRSYSGWFKVCRLQANIFELGGMDSNLTFFWERMLIFICRDGIPNVSRGLHSILLSNLGLHGYYRAVVDSCFQW